MNDALAVMLTMTTHGTSLSSEERRCVEHDVILPAEPLRVETAPPETGAPTLWFSRDETQFVGKLVGTAGRRDMLGARAGVVRTDGTTLWRRVGATASYASSSDPRLLFGLGDDDAVSEVVVEWPDGSAESWGPETVRLDAYTTLRQGFGKGKGA